MAETRLLVYNPASGARLGKGIVDVICRHFHEHGWNVLPTPTPGPGMAADLVRAHADRISGVIALGGDGTINEILPAVVHQPLTLSILPAGTANVLARELGLSSRPLDAIPRIVNGRCQPVTVGRAGDRYFICMMGAGYDAAITAGVSPQLKRHLGMGAFLLESVRQLHSYPFPSIRFRSGSRTWTAPFGVIANSRLYGGSFALAPKAGLEDSRLDLCLFPSAQRFWPLLGYTLRALAGRHIGSADVVYEKITEVRLEADSPVPYQVDGEPAGTLPVRVQSCPKALRLILPA